jgi:hypothetical protein
VRYNAVATSSPAVTSTPYRLTIRSDNPGAAMLALCTSGNTCNSSVVAGYRYWATVEDYGGTNFGSSSAYNLSGDSIVEMDANGLNALAIAAQFSTTRALCDALLVAPRYLGTYDQRSTVSDQWIACDTAAEAGYTQVQAVTAILLVTGAAVVAWASLHPEVSPPPAPGCQDSGTCPPPPTPPMGPVTAPPGQAPSVGTLASRIGAKNDLTISNVDLETLARECMVRLVEAGHDSEDCATLPIFVTGYHGNEAAIHDRQALTTGVPGSSIPPDPRWILLNYMRGALQPPPGRGWMDGKPEWTRLEVL